MLAGKVLNPACRASSCAHSMYQNPVVTAPLGVDGLPMQVDERYVQVRLGLGACPWTPCMHGRRMQAPPPPPSTSPLQTNYEEFYEDVFEEVAQFGEVENLNVCDNIADHLVGNVYIKFRDEEAAARSLQALQGRFYDGRPIIAEFSPVTDFREATCRQYEENTCNRGGYCNFMHLKPISKDLRKRLFGRCACMAAACMHGWGGSLGSMWGKAHAGMRGACRLGHAALQVQ